MSGFRVSTRTRRPPTVFGNVVDSDQISDPESQEQLLQRRQAEHEESDVDFSASEDDDDDASSFGDDEEEEKRPSKKAAGKAKANSPPKPKAKVSVKPVRKLPPVTKAKPAPAPKTAKSAKIDIKPKMKQTKLSLQPRKVVPVSSSEAEMSDAKGDAADDESSDAEDKSDATNGKTTKPIASTTKSASSSTTRAKPKALFLKPAAKPLLPKSKPSFKSKGITLAKKVVASSSITKTVSKPSKPLLSKAATAKTSSTKGKAKVQSDMDEDEEVGKIDTANEHDTTEDDANAEDAKMATKKGHKNQPNGEQTADDEAHDDATNDEEEEPAALDDSQYPTPPPEKLAAKRQRSDASAITNGEAGEYDETGASGPPTPESKGKRKPATSFSTPKKKPAPAQTIPGDVRRAIIDLFADAKYTSHVDFAAAATPFKGEGMTNNKFSRHWREVLAADLRTFARTGEGRVGRPSKTGGLGSAHRRAIWDAVRKAYDKADWASVAAESGIDTTKLKRHFRDVLVKDVNNFIG